MILSPSPDVCTGKIEEARPSWAMAAILHSAGLRKGAFVKTIPIVVLQAIFSVSSDALPSAACRSLSCVLKRRKESISSLE